MVYYKGNLVSKNIMQELYREWCELPDPNPPGFHAWLVSMGYEVTNE